MRTVILGDVHLGSPLCRTGQLLAVLHNVPFDRLVLNGDIFDDINFRRLRARHWAVLDRLRQLGEDADVVWVCGNHDGSPQALRRLLGVEVRTEYAFEFRGEKVVVLHGHEFDEFHRATRGLARLREKFYGFAIWFDVPRKTAIQWFQRSTDVFERAVRRVKVRAVQHARHRGARWVVAGHTHHREVDTLDGVTFLNPSSWLTSNPAYVLFDDAHAEPRMVVMGARGRRGIARTVRTSVRKARRTLSRRLK